LLSQGYLRQLHQAWLALLRERARLVDKIAYLEQQLQDAKVG
jgi:hypothetical protein